MRQTSFVVGRSASIDAQRGPHTTRKREQPLIQRRTAALLRFQVPKRFVVGHLTLGALRAKTTYPFFLEVQKPFLQFLRLMYFV